MSPLNAAQMLGKAAALGATRTSTSTVRKLADQTATTTQRKPGGGVAGGVSLGTLPAATAAPGAANIFATDATAVDAHITPLPLLPAADNFRKAVSEHSVGRLHNQATGKMEEAQRKLKQFHETQPDALAPSDLVQWKSLLEQLETAKYQVESLRK